jgi:hypothetical protein
VAAQVLRSERPQAALDSIYSEKFISELGRLSIRHGRAARFADGARN